MTSPTRIVLGPLTTTFIPGPSCSVYAYDRGNPGLFFNAQYCDTSNLREDASCWPEATVAPPNPPLNGWGLYSPGLICPHGHTEACSSTAGVSAGFNFEFSLNAGETAMGCCPSGMFCTLLGGVQRCGRQFTTSTTISRAGYCGQDGPGFESITSVALGSYSSTDAGHGTTPAVAFAPLFQRVFQSSDLTSSISPTSATNTPSPTPQASQNVQASQDAGLSTGAKIGIGVGVPLAVILLVALGAFIFLYRRERLRNRQPIGPVGQEIAEKPADQLRRPPVEVHSNPHDPNRYDAYKYGPVELNNTPYHQRSELPTYD